MRKLALLLNSLSLSLLVFSFFYFLIVGYGDLHYVAMSIATTPFLLFSLFNLIAIYKCKQIYKGRNTIQTLAVVFTLIIFIFVYLFWSKLFNSHKDDIYVLVVAGIISVLPFLNLFVLYKCKEQTFPKEEITDKIL